MVSSSSNELKQPINKRIKLDQPSIKFVRPVDDDERHLETCYDNPDTDTKKKAVIYCRSIRIGSFKFQSPNQFSLMFEITGKSVSFTVPTVLDEQTQVEVTIPIDDIPSVLASFDKRLTIFYFNTTPDCGSMIRSKLQMTDESNCYYDPCSSNEISKMITVLPVEINEEQRETIKGFCNSLQAGKFREIDAVKANLILVKSAQVYALCGHCGQLSKTYTQCNYCQRFVIKPPRRCIESLKPEIKLISIEPSLNKFLSTSGIGTKIASSFTKEPNLSIYKKMKVDQPNTVLCLTRSLDDELEKPETSETKINNVFTGSVSPSLTAKGFHGNKMVTSSSNETKQPIYNEIIKVEKETGSGNLYVDTKNKVEIYCRSIRIGSYKVCSPEPACLMFKWSEKGVSFSCPAVPDEQPQVEVTVPMDGIPSVLACFDKRLPVIYIYTTSDCGSMIRSRLKMTNKSLCYYDPCGSDETSKRITVLPVEINEEQRETIKGFCNSLQSSKFLEIDTVMANEILVKSKPVQGKMVSQVTTSSFSGLVPK